MEAKRYLAVSSLVLTVAGTAMISRFEDGPVGPSLEAYLDSVQVPTICTGSTKGVFIGMLATPSECEHRLVEDTTYAGLAVHRLVKVKLTQEMYNSLVSFTFNCGPGALATSTLLVKLNQGLYCEAGKQFYRWDHAGGRKLRGLTVRRKQEAVPFIEECK